MPSGPPDGGSHFLGGGHFLLYFVGVLVHHKRCKKYRGCEFGFTIKGVKNMGGRNFVYHFRCINSVGLKSGFTIKGVKKWGSKIWIYQKGLQNLWGYKNCVNH